MREKLMKKLHSDRGASLTFALLLFLVCAAVGSVVLASATATAGRVSENYDYDQRYYAVTSAAELLRSALGGQTFTYEFTKTSYVDRTTTTVMDADGVVQAGYPAVAEGDPYGTAYALTLKRADGSTIDWKSASPANDLGGLLAASLVSGKAENAALFAASGWLTPASPVLPGEMTLTIENTTGGVDAAGLAVTVTPTLGSDGSLTLTLQNATGDASYKYRLALTLSPDVLETPLRTTEVLDSYDTDDDTDDEGVKTTVRTDKYERTETRSATVTWRVSEVGKGGATS